MQEAASKHNWILKSQHQPAHTGENTSRATTPLQQAYHLLASMRSDEAERLVEAKLRVSDAEYTATSSRGKEGIDRWVVSPASSALGVRWEIRASERGATSVILHKRHGSDDRQPTRKHTIPWPVPRPPTCPMPNSICHTTCISRPGCCSEKTCCRDQLEGARQTLKLQLSESSRYRRRQLTATSPPGPPPPRPPPRPPPPPYPLAA